MTELSSSELLGGERTAPEVLVSARHLVQEFVVHTRGGLRGGVVHAVSDVSFDIHLGETLGIVGETGSGKSTLARSVLQAPRPKAGEVFFRGQDLVRLNRRELRDARAHVAMIFQDPYASLDPKWKVGDIVAEPLRARNVGTEVDRRRRVNDVLDLVGLDPSVYSNRRPRQLSGGQCQRVAIARAVTLSPSLIVCDEAVSSLDVLIQAQVLNLFELLREQLNLSYLFIAHDLALVKQVSDRLGVMYLGKLCEIGRAESIYRSPLHPYTSALLASIPNPDPNAKRILAGETISGEPPSPILPPSGCRFRTRCPRAQDVCAEVEPDMRLLGPDHSVACHFPLASDVSLDLMARRDSSMTKGPSSGFPAAPMV